MNASSSSFASARFVVALLASLVSVCAVACSSREDGAPASEGEGDAEATDQDVTASCTYPRRYFVTFGEATDEQPCTPIAGRRGQWLPEPLFADAPEDVQLSTCAYRWSGEKYSRPDRDAIAARVGNVNALAPACGTSVAPDIGALEPIPHLDVLSQAGSVGCDVCGVLRNGKLWVILPPEKIATKQLEVRLDNGQTRAFQIQNADARALSITLPPPPAGAQYRQERVRVY